MAKTQKDKVERIDQETGEVTCVDPETIEDAEIVPKGDPTAPNDDTAEEVPAAEGGEPAAEPVPVDEPEHVHAYDAGAFHPELRKMEGQMRDFMLARIRNNWKPWQQMTVEEQQDLVNAVEQQARDTIRGTVRAINDYEWPHCMVTLGQVTLKGSEKGIEGKIIAPMVAQNLDFLGQHVEKRVMLVATDAETFFGSDRIKYDGRGSQMDLPLGGSVKDIEAGGFAAEEAALRAPVLDGPEPDPLAPEEGEETELDEDKPGFVWPDDVHLGMAEVDSGVEGVTLLEGQGQDSGNEPGEA